MKKILLFLLSTLPIWAISQGGPECSQMEPICTNVGLNFTANSGVAEASTTDPGNDYDCLITQPNPTWYYFEIATAGNINMNLNAPSDIDYIIWGPFSSLSAAQAQCGDLGNPAAEIVDCSYSPTNDEYPVIPSAVVGQVYVMLITNYADVVQNVTLTQVGGTGSTDCSIVTNPPCAMTAFDVSISGCEFATGTYDVTGSISYTDAPTSGSLIVEDCNGNTVVVDTYPFAASPQSFSLNNLTANGLACDVTAYFTADATCTQTYNYVAPVCLADCPSYDLQSVSPTETCGNQVYYLEVQNSGCDGYVSFTVEGNYGSSYASEITWEVISNLTGTAVAAGGPGTNGTSFNVVVGPLDPAVYGSIFNLIVYDSYGDGFEGSGGYIQTETPTGTILAGPITGLFGSETNQYFQAGVIVSTSTITVTTPSGIVTSTIGSCQDHEVEITLANNNFCTPIEVDLPWEIKCNTTNAVIASGIHTVVVYPQVPDQASDVVSITWNPATCSYDVSPNNDCSDLDIGNLFTISPDPSGITSYCSNGTQNFTVNYLGFPSGPDCCSTAGPLVPITYTNSIDVTDFAPQNAYAGTNNSAYGELPSNGAGGNATSVDIAINGSGYCYPDGVNSPGFNQYYVDVYVNGVQVMFQGPIYTTSFSYTLNEADLAAQGVTYTENSTVQVYVLPNNFSYTSGPWWAPYTVYTNYTPGISCGSLGEGDWNISSLNVSVDAVFEQMLPTPVSCALPLSAAYTCCTTAPITATPPAPVTVACPSAIPAVNIASVTGITSTCPTTVTHVSDVPASITCSGTVVRTYRVTNSCGTYIDVTQNITVSAPTVTMPSNGASTVACPALATAPVTPTVLDNCGRALSVSAPTVSPTPACSGTKTYSYTYTDCAGVTYPWSYTYTISAPVVTMPAAGSSTVACVSAATAPAAPSVNDNCGRPLSVTGPVASADPACAGTKTYTYTYTDCAGATYNWVYTYTISAPVVTMPAAGSSTVACVSAATAPAAPSVSDNCGRPLSVTGPVASADPACSGTKTYTYTYTDCAGATYNWVYTYTISAPVVTMPAAGSSTVACVSAATAPAAPSVSDNCGRPLSVTGPVASADPACAGSKTYTYTYTDCAGATYDWVYTYTISAPVVTMPAAGSSTVMCVSDATAPAAPAVNDNCGRPLSVTGPVASPDPLCSGTKTYTYTYTDCAGATYNWVYTYTINDNIAPTASNPSDLSVPGGSFPTPDPAVVTDEADNCDPTPTVTWLTDVSDNGVCPETITRTYRITDDCGNFTDVVQLIYVGDAIPPTASNPAPINVECSADVPVPNVSVVIDEADNGTAPVVTWEDDMSDNNTCPETITRRYRVTDDCGNFIFVTQTITVEDVTTPVFAAAPSNTTVSCPADVPAMTDLGWTDNCDGSGLATGVDVSDGNTCPETITRTWTYTDACGNTATATQVITVHDLVAPVFAAAPSDVTVACAADVPASTDLGWTDNCDGSGLATASDVSDGNTCPETITRTWTYTDACGNTATATQTITVHDLIAPVFAAAPSNTTVQCSADVPALTDLSWTDNCDGTGLATAIDVSDGNTCPETITRTWTYTDACGNTATATQTILVDDTTPPTASNPATTTVPGGPAPSVDVTVVTDEADNCTVAPVVAFVSESTDGGTCPETITRIYSVTDNCGNTINVTHTILITDPIMPTASNPAPISFECSADVPAPDPAVVIDEADNNGIPDVLFVSDVSDGNSCPETITRTYSVTDDCANQILVTQTITIQDVTTPVFAAAPSNTTVSCPADVPAMTDLGWTDNCDGSGLVTGVDVSDGNTCPETITRTWTYTDACGNTATATQVITVHDLIAPVFAAAPSDVTVACAADVPASTDLGWTDNCDGSGLATASDVSDGNTCPETITRTWTYTDACGNTATATQTITVHDLVAPVFAAAPSDITVACAADVPAITDLGWTDNCDGSGLATGSDVSDGNTCPETITRTWTYTDACGNTATATQTITVHDLVAPVFASAPTTATVQCSADVPAMTNLGWTDNCDGAGSVSGTDVSDGNTCPETITRTWTYTDACGNVATATQTIIVDDTTPPVASNPSTTTVPGGPAPAVDVTVVTGETDNCTAVPVVAFVSETTDGGICPETITRIYSVTDDCGNVTNVTHTIIITDPILPTASNPAPISVECTADVPAPDPAVVTDEADNNGVPVVVFVSDASDGNSCPETITRTYSVTDNCSNQILVTQTITVLDITAPTASTPTAINVECIGDVPAPSPLAVSDAMDNCSTPIVTWMSDVSDGNTCPETILRTYSVADDCGNSINVIQTIVVNDVTAPTASNPASIAVECIGDVPAPDVNVVTDEADNCSAPVVAFVSEVSDGNTCPETITRTYSVTDACGNTMNVTQTIVVQDVTAPTASAPASLTFDDASLVPGPDVTIITDESDNCSATPVVAWVSDVSDGQLCPETITRTYSITDDCGNETLVSQTIIIDSKCEIVIPTAFTPNNDGENDVWQIVDLDLLYPNNVVYVYNRWGNLIYESQKGNYASRPWDGKVNGELLPVGSYYYILYTEGDKSGEIMNGTVSIIKK